MVAIIEIIRLWLWIVLPLLLLQLGLLTAGLISLLRKRVTFSEKLPWLVLVVLVNTIGPILYFIIGAPKLEERAAEREDLE